MFKRVNSDVVPFSINSPAGNRYVFGTADVSNDIDANYNENIKKGFGTGPNEFPELEDFNALMFTGSYLAAYLYQAGIPEWNDKQKYYINSIVMSSDGNLYKSLAGTEESPNVNNNPTLAGSTSWKSILSDYALLNGDETKKFKVEDAVEPNEAINKKQLNEAIDSLNQEISLTGTATFNGTTQNINLTNIGNITLAIGDVIEVSETTSNNKLFTVESIVDNNNIVVNYEHRGSIVSIPSKKLINETTICTIKLYNRAKNAELGEGQGWVFYESTADRGNLIAYPSLPTRTMAVACYMGESGKSFQISNNGTVWKNIFLSPTISGVQMYTQNIIPSGVFYRANGLQGVNSTFPWAELR